MFTRQVFRATQPIKHNIRRYATGDPPPPSHRSLFLFAGVVIVGSVGAGILITRRNDARLAAKPSVLKTEAKKAFTGGDQGFIDLRLDSVENINHNTKRFRYALPEPDMVSGLQIASALLTKYQGPGMDKPVIRPYTPVSNEDEKGYLDFVIKRYPNGPMSEHIHDMTPPQTLSFKGPIHKYPYRPNMHSHIALIAGGTGITPMYQLVRGIFNNPDDKTRVTLVFGNLTEPDILLKKEFEELENTYPQRFRAFYVLDDPPEGWMQGKGHITKELLKMVLPGKEEKDAKVFVCGPPGLYRAVSGTKKSPSDQGELGGMLKELGYEKEQVFKF